MAADGLMGATGAVGNAVNDALAPFELVASAQLFSPDRFAHAGRSALVVRRAVQLDAMNSGMATPRRGNHGVMTTALGARRAGRR
jgi:hypothetical protein